MSRYSPYLKGDKGSSFWIDVKDYATGNGTTDDTSAIQAAVNAAVAAKKPLFFPFTSTSYLISDTITLPSNTHIIGDNAKIFMASKSGAATARYMLNTSSSVYTDNITIEDIKLASLNNRAGEAGSYFESQTVSNVYGMGFPGVTNLNIQNVTMTDLISGIVTMPNSVPTNLSKNINIRNVKIYNTSTPILTKNTRDFFLSDSILDATGSTNTHLHCWYIDTDCQNIYVDNVKFLNSTGGAGLQIYSEENIPLQNAVFNNITIENCKVGAFIYRGALQIAISNITVKGCQNIINVNDCNGVSITGGTATNVTSSLFYLDNATNLIISDMVIDGASLGTTYSQIRLLRTQQNVLFDNVIFKNLPCVANVNFCYPDGTTVEEKVIMKNVTFQNCSLDFNNPDAGGSSIPFGVFNANDELLVQGCRFTVNTGSNFPTALYGAAGTKAVVRNCTFTGFTKIANLTNSILLDNIIGGKSTRASGSTSIADGGTITHGLPGNPTSVRVSGSIASQIVSVTAKTTTTFTVAIKTTAGAAGTTQTVYWDAEYNL